MGHDVAGQQLVAAQYLLPRGPVLHPDHELAEAPAHLLQSFDAGDAIVGGAHDPLVVLYHVVDDLVKGHIGLPVAQGLVKILRDHPGAANADVLKGLLAALRQVEATYYPPVLPAHCLAMLRR